MSPWWLIVICPVCAAFGAITMALCCVLALDSMARKKT